jgi:hypothetical protein
VAQVKQLPRRPALTAEQYAACIKYEPISNELHDIAVELEAVHWAAFGLGEVIADGDRLKGIESIAGRLSVRLKEIAKEVWS